MIRDPWEDIRHATLDQVLTRVKLAGSGFAINGHTTPEGWPFMVLLAVGSPGNEQGLEYTREASAKIAAIASANRYSFNPSGSLLEQAAAKEREEIAQMVDQMATVFEGHTHQAIRTVADAIRARK